MARVDDVAAAILKRTGRIDTFKFQKLVYYCQAWHLVWESRPLFRATIEAWANGPVVPHLYNFHRQAYQVERWPSGSATRLSASEQSTVDAVVEHYGGLSGSQLAEMTHREQPWLDARADLPPGERSDTEISPAAMLEYYGSLI